MDVAEESEFARVEGRHEVGSCLEAGERFTPKGHFALARNQRDVVEDPGIAIVEGNPDDAPTGHLKSCWFERDVSGDHDDGRGRRSGGLSRRRLTDGAARNERCEQESPRDLRRAVAQGPGQVLPPSSERKNSVERVTSAIVCPPAVTAMAAG